MGTPLHAVPSLDHLVTQWMSVVSCSCGSASNSAQLHCAFCPPAPASVKLHVASGVCGVGPAESTGKSCVSYWPGGNLVAPGAGRRPRKPREIGEVMFQY